jgi:hypothetical protein
MARLYPAPDDGLTTAEWIRKEREARTDGIIAAASRPLDEEDEAG